jgi:hypothetical protein
MAILCVLTAVIGNALFFTMTARIYDFPPGSRVGAASVAGSSDFVIMFTLFMTVLSGDRAISQYSDLSARVKKAVEYVVLATIPLCTVEFFYVLVVGLVRGLRFVPG